MLTQKKRRGCREKLQELHSIVQKIFEEEQSSYKMLEAVSNIEDLDATDAADFKLEVEENEWKKLLEGISDHARLRMNLKLELYAAAGLPTETLIKQENRWLKLTHLLNQSRKD